MSDQKRDPMRIVNGSMEVDTRPLTLSFRQQCAIAAMKECMKFYYYSTDSAPDCAADAFVFADAMEAEDKKRSEK